MPPLTASPLSKPVLSKPVFLAASVRSGTTLLRLMLDHHPQIAWCNEFEYTVDWINPDGSWPDLQAYHRWLNVDRIFQGTGFQIDPDLTYPELIDSFLRQRLDQSGKPLVGATVHRHFDRVLYVWPDARFIHLVRDGRDMARSFIGMGWAGNMWTAIGGWITIEHLWDQLSAKLSPDRILEIRYSDLILNTVETLTQICQFIGTDYDPAMLSYADKTNYSLPDPSLLDQWKQKLSAFEIRLAEARAREMLQKRGFELSGLDPLDITPPLKLWLRTQDRWSRIQFRHQRYGTRLFLAELVSRRLNLEPWHRQIRLQLNEIDKTYLK